MHNNSSHRKTSTRFAGAFTTGLLRHEGDFTLLQFIGAFLIATFLLSFALLVGTAALQSRGDLSLTAMLGLFVAAMAWAGIRIFKMLGQQVWRKIGSRSAPRSFL
jgi:NO-binding membrane sensor protein with MHYT domain